MESWGIAFTEARQRLIESGDFVSIRRRGHELRDGAVLTAVSDVPFEMSFKCVRCGEAFWFENFAWDTGGIAQWRLNGESRARAQAGCTMPHAHAVADLGRERRAGGQP